MLNGTIGVGTTNVSTASSRDTPELWDHQYHFVPNCADLVSDSCGIEDKMLPNED